MFATKIEIPDLHTAVSFLIKPVRALNKYDWGKIACMIS